MLLHLALGALHLLRGFVAAGDEELGELRARVRRASCRSARARVRQDCAAISWPTPRQGLADPLAVVGKRLALARKLADQAADAELVVAVRALERSRPRYAPGPRARRRGRWRGKWRRSWRRPGAGWFVPTRQPTARRACLARPMRTATSVMAEAISRIPGHARRAARGTRRWRWARESVTRAVSADATAEER